MVTQVRKVDAWRPGTRLAVCAALIQCLLTLSAGDSCAQDSARPAHRLASAASSGSVPKPAIPALSGHRSGPHLAVHPNPSVPMRQASQGAVSPPGQSSAIVARPDSGYAPGQPLFSEGQYRSVITPSAAIPGSAAHGFTIPSHGEPAPGRAAQPLMHPGRPVPLDGDLMPPSIPTQGSLSENIGPPVSIDAEKVFSFNFKSAPWDLVLRQFSSETGTSLQFSHTVDGVFTYFDEKRYSLREALDIFNDYLLPQGAILLRQGNKLTLLGASAGIPDGFIPFVSLNQLPVLGRNEMASIAIPLTRSDPDRAAEEIRRFLSPVGRVQPLSNSRRVIVADTGAYLRRVYDLVTGAGIAASTPRAFVYELRHAKAEQVANAINQFYSAESGPSGGAANGQVVVAEKTTNSLLIRDMTGDSSEIYAMVQQLDRPPRQVLIQALLVEVQLGDTDEFGVELGFQDSVLFDRSVIDNIVTVTETLTSPVGTQTTNQRIISQTAAPGFNFNNQALGNNVAIAPSRVGSQALSSFGVGRVNGDLGFGGLVLSAGSESVNVLLRALDARFDVDVLSRPQVRAVDNHEALIQIGQQVPVVDGVAVTATGSANPVIRQDKAGIILKVTPQISPDSRVLIDVQAEKSAFQLAAGTGVPIFTDATSGNVIEAPVKDITTANTLVSVRSGQTVVLGGMITNEEVIVERKVPFLGDIPLINKAFRHDYRDSTRRELLIFLTPHVVESDCHSDELTQRELARVHLSDAAMEFEQVGGHTWSFPSGHCGVGGAGAGMMGSDQGCVPAE